jgi:signal transduction histidine kinase
MLGVLCVGHREQGRFGEEETRLLTLLANAGAIALENARLYKQAEQAATLAERERIVAEIHDGLAQTLGFLGVRLATVRGLIADEAMTELPDHLALMQQTIKQANQEARRLMADLRVRPQGQRTLDEILEQTIEQFAGGCGLEVAFQAETRQPAWEPPEVQEQVVRILLEALTNVHKHARSGRATVTMERSDGQTVVSVRDDGPGFDAGSPFGEGHHFGLKVMETRARRIGGELSVESVLGQGTTVTLRWPGAGG